MPGFGPRFRQGDPPGCPRPPPTGWWGGSQCRGRLLRSGAAEGQGGIVRSVDILGVRWPAGGSGPPGWYELALEDPTLHPGVCVGGGGWVGCWSLFGCGWFLWVSACGGVLVVLCGGRLVVRGFCGFVVVFWVLCVAGLGLVIVSVGGGGGASAVLFWASGLVRGMGGERAARGAGKEVCQGLGTVGRGVFLGDVRRLTGAFRRNQLHQPLAASASDDLGALDLPKGVPGLPESGDQSPPISSMPGPAKSSPGPFRWGGPPPRRPGASCSVRTSTASATWEISASRTWPSSNRDPAPPPPPVARRPRGSTPRSSASNARPPGQERLDALRGTLVHPSPARRAVAPPPWWRRAPAPAASGHRRTAPAAPAPWWAPEREAGPAPSAPPAPPSPWSLQGSPRPANVPQHDPSGPQHEPRPGRCGGSGLPEPPGRSSSGGAGPGCVPGPEGGRSAPRSVTRSSASAPPQRSQRGGPTLSVQEGEDPPRWRASGGRAESSASVAMGPTAGPSPPRARPPHHRHPPPRLVPEGARLPDAGILAVGPPPPRTRGSRSS